MHLQAVLRTWKGVSSCMGSMLSVLILCSGAECGWYVMRCIGSGAVSSRSSFPLPVHMQEDMPSLQLLLSINLLHNCTLSNQVASLAMPELTISKGTSSECLAFTAIIGYCLLNKQACMSGQRASAMLSRQHFLRM